MMRLLHWVLARDEYLATQVFPEAEWGPRPERVKGAGEGWVSALWSDVGPRFYGECGMKVGSDSESGWIIRDPISTVWKLQEVNAPEEMTDSRETTWLDEQLVKGILDEDAEQIKTEVVQKAREKNKTQFSFLPDEGVAMYQWFRLHYHFSRHVQNPPKYCGVRIGERAFAIWTCEFRPGSPKTLIVTRLRADAGTVEGLIACALKYATRYGMEEVEVWNLPRDLEEIVNGYGGKHVVREEHLPAIKWYSEEEGEWMYNERFCWC